MFENTPRRVRCDIGDQSESPIEPPAAAAASSSSLTNMDVDVAMDAFRPPLTPLIVDNTGLDHITCLERTVCSNYFCCGSQHPDLHALLEHFEEDHVIVLAPNGKRLYPSEGFRSVTMAVDSSPTVTPTSSRSSSVIPLSPSLSSSSSTSASSGPSSPSSTSTPTPTPVPRRKSSLTVPVPPVYTPFTPSLPVDPSDPYGLDPATEVIMSDDETMYSFPPFSLFPVEVQASGFGSNRSSLSPPEFDPSSSSSSGSDGDEDMSDTCSIGASPIDHPDAGAGANSLPPYVYGTDKIKPIPAIPKHVSFAVAPSGSSSTSAAASPPTRKSARSSSVAATDAPTKQSQTQITTSAKSKGRNRPAVGSSSRKREKVYRCPAYLNPNGLKYHMEKGTCKLEDEIEVNVSEESNHSDSPSGAADETKNVQMQDSLSGDGAEDPLGHGHNLITPCAILPSDSNTPTPLPFPQSSPPQHRAQYVGQAQVTSSASGVTTLTSTPVSVEGASPSPNASAQPQQQPAVYHYPVPTYPQYTAASYFRRPYYTSTNSNVGADATSSAQHSHVSQSLSLQHPQPIAISSSRMQ